MNVRMSSRTRWKCSGEQAHGAGHDGEEGGWELFQVSPIEDVKARNSSRKHRQNACLEGLVPEPPCLWRVTTVQYNTIQYDVSIPLNWRPV